MHGEPMPESVTKGQPIAQLQNQKLKCFGPQHPFTRYGESGQEMTTLFPKIGEVADEICIVRSMQTEQINHDPAHTFMNTGTQISGRPAAGSWIWYGIGSEAEDLPGFVVLTSQGRGGQMQPIAARQWHSGFLPSRFQGVQFRSKGDAVLYLRDPEGTTHAQQREVIDAVQALTAAQPDWVDDPEVQARLSQYEMAFKMQTSVPALTDFASEPRHVLEAYGCESLDGSFAANCLLARRLAERGVRFIQLYHRDWDHHSRHQGRHRDEGARGGPGHRRPHQGPASSAACSTTRWSSGAASSAARPWPRATAAITTSRASRCGWPAAASRAASATARPTSSATTPWRT